MVNELNFTCYKCDNRDWKQSSLCSPRKTPLQLTWYYSKWVISHWAEDDLLVLLWLLRIESSCLFLCGCLIFFKSPLVRKTLPQGTEIKFLFSTGVAMASLKERGGFDNLGFDVSTMTYSCKIYHMKTFLSILSKRSEHHQEPVNIQNKRCFWSHIFCIYLYICKCKDCTLSSD